MKRIVVTAIIAVILSAFSLSAQNAKTTYIIDGQKVENFDGSQLAGKTIVSYTVRNNTHVVTTADYKEPADNEAKIVSVGTVKMTEAKTFIENDIKIRGADKEKIVFVIDGKPATYEQFKSMSTSNIESVSVIKAKDSPEFKKYAKPDATAVMIIQTR